MIRLKGVSKSFRKLQVLNNLDFEVGKQELIYIHGINGCGKSTLLKIIADILEADKGKYEKDSNVKIGALIENPGFLEGLTLKQNFKFLGDLTNSYDEQKCKDLCSMFQLDFNNRNPMRSYSVGMRQKAGIIQSVMENQNLVLFDEPTRGLDRESVECFKVLLNNMISEGKSIIVATHEPLEDICFTSSYELKNGRLYKE